METEQTPEEKQAQLEFDRGVAFATSVSTRLRGNRHTWSTSSSQNFRSLVIELDNRLSVILERPSQLAEPEAEPNHTSVKARQLYRGARLSSVASAFVLNGTVEIPASEAWRTVDDEVHAELIEVTDGWLAESLAGSEPEPGTAPEPQTEEDRIIKAFADCLTILRRITPLGRARVVRALLGLLGILGN